MNKAFILGVFTAMMIAVVSFNSCDKAGDGDDDGNNSTVQSGTYTGEKDGTKFTLKVTKGSGASGSPTGSNYELTASSKKSTGNIIDNEDNLLTLQPSNSSSVFFATVHEKNLSSIYEPITWSDGSTSRAPGVFPGNFPYIPDYNIRESCRQMYGTFVYKNSSDHYSRFVWDEANLINASTTPDYTSYGVSCVNGDDYYWSYDDIHGRGGYMVCPNSCNLEGLSWTPYYWWGNYVWGERVFPDREIAGKTCSVYNDDGRITAYYRCIIFLKIDRDGIVSREVTSFSEEVTGYLPPPGYPLSPGGCDEW